MKFASFVETVINASPTTVIVRFHVVPLAWKVHMGSEGYGGITRISAKDTFVGCRVAGVSGIVNSN